jgi:hypothetical protein
VFSVLANVVWPALFLAGWLCAWWCILGSVLLEAAALWRFARVRPVKATVASTVMNAVSALCGALLIPLLGIRWEIFAGLTYQAWFGWGTFNWITEVATCCIAILLNTIVEVFVLWLVFIMPLRRRLVVVVLAANATTVTLAWATMLVFVRRWGP